MVAVRHVGLFCGMVVSVYQLAWAKTESIVLDPTKMTEISFDSIPKTQYTFEDGVLKAVVRKSSSALILPFDKVKVVTDVSFVWQLIGEVKTKDAAQEETKGGDDYPLRIGFCLQGETPWIPFFAPVWIKKIGEIMRHPADKLIYLVAGSKHEAGKTWISPYSDSMSFVALADRNTMKDKAWKFSSHAFGKPLKVVGLWIMGDGDNTASQFQVKLKDLNLNP